MILFFSFLEEIPPEDVGLYHTDAFESLADKLALQELESHDAMIDHLVNVAASYCSNDECIEQTFASAAEHVSMGMIDPYTELPEDFSPILKEYLESLRTTILSGKVGNGEEIINKLTMIQSKMQGDTTMNEEEKFIGVSATSVAIESTKLWSSVFSDAEHPLRGITKLNSHGRNLQVGETTIAGSVIVADVIGLLLFFGFPIGSIIASYLAYSGFLIPSDTPSISPTSEVPSGAPSLSPSMSPIPSTAPSALPTQIPSPIPSSAPSDSPSESPSKSPSPT